MAAMSVQESYKKWQDIYNSLPQTPHKYFMVAEDIAGQVCGYSSIEVSNDISRWATQLTTLYVLPTHHKQGIGKQLLAAAKIWALQQSASTLGLWVFSENKTAIDFYIAQGFSKTTHTKEKTVGTQTHILDGYVLKI